MRTAVLFLLLFLTTRLTAQTSFNRSAYQNAYRSGFVSAVPFSDSTTKRKWTLTRYSALSASYTFFKGGQASIISAPMGLQLNRRLTDHVYAFANATVAPAYVNIVRPFTRGNFGKEGSTNFLATPGKLGMYSSASLGLMYVNSEKSFSVSGSISVERGSYPLVPYYYEQRPNTSNVRNR
jgi:hypothetical protein